MTDSNAAALKKRCLVTAEQCKLMEAFTSSSTMSPTIERHTSAMKECKYESAEWKETLRSVCSECLQRNCLQMLHGSRRREVKKKYANGSSTSVGGNEHGAFEDRRKLKLFLPLLDSEINFPVARNSNTPSRVSVWQRTADLITVIFNKY